MSTVFESPLDNVGLGGSTLHMVALRELRPEVVEVLKLDKVPYIAQRSGDDS